MEKGMYCYSREEVHCRDLPIVMCCGTIYGAGDLRVKNVFFCGWEGNCESCIS